MMIIFKINLSDSFISLTQHNLYQIDELGRMADFDLHLFFST